MRMGGFSPLPWTLGGGEPRVKTIYDSLNQGLGTAYDTSDASNVTAETMAEARALDAVWANNRRMAFVTDPKRVPAELLSRWEKILDIHPSVGASDFDRRSAIEAKYLAWIGPSALVDLVTALIGGNLVGIEFSDLAHALIKWPANGFPNDWISTIAFINIRVQFTPNQTLAEFVNKMAAMTAALDDFLPSWAAFNWSTFNSMAGAGFLLDDPQNLDFESFD